MKKILEYSLNLLNHANNKAHFVNFSESMVEQLIFNLSRFSGNKDYLSLIDILKILNIENDLEKLVKNRLEKYQKSKEDFINNQNIIKEAIQKNPLIAKGNGLNTLMNS